MNICARHINHAERDDTADDATESLAQTPIPGCLPTRLFEELVDGSHYWYDSGRPRHRWRSHLAQVDLVEEHGSLSRVDQPYPDLTPGVLCGCDQVLYDA